VSEMPIENVPGLADAARQAADGGGVVHLTEHGRRLAVVMAAGAYDRLKRLQDESDRRRVVEGSADDRPGRVFSSAEEMMRAAGIA
jgi:hypothetical protein